MNEEIAEELESHVEEGVAAGRDRREVRRAMGVVMRAREESHQARVVGWVDSLRADVVFGWRQLWKRKVTTLAAVVSLGLAMGSCVAAFRLVDALFLRPMPVRDASNLYIASYEGLNGRGEHAVWDTASYPLFARMREAEHGQAQMAAAEYSYPTSITFGGFQEMETAQLEAVSGDYFSVLGLKPELGRLLQEDDDRVEGAHPVVVLSYEFWQRRFQGEGSAIGRTFHLGSHVYEVVGVAPKGFSGTEPGTMVDFFMPTAMENGLLKNENAAVLRVFVRPEPGVRLEMLASRLDAEYQRSEKERSKGWVNMPKYLLANWPNAHLSLKPAGAGISSLQQGYGPALMALMAVVGLVLLIACANVANLMAGQAGMRSREMAVRVSLGAGRRRLMRMVLVESAMLCGVAVMVGLGFAWWAAPYVVGRMSAAEHTVRLALRPDWTVTGFGAALAMLATLLFGLLPAVRASRVQPAGVLKVKGGGESLERRRSMYVLIAAQVAFCFVVLFVAGLFTSTLSGLLHRPLGFAAERLLVIHVAAQQPQTLMHWEELVDQIRATPGVKNASMSDWALLEGVQQNNYIDVPGRPDTNVLAYFLNVQPGWMDTMRIPLLAGRDLNENDRSGQTALVNETFAKTYFGGMNPVGRSFRLRGLDKPITIAGVTGDTLYKGVREKQLPVVLEPMRADSSNGQPQTMWFTTVMARIEAGAPRAMEETIRKTIVAWDPGIRVRLAQTQMEILNTQLLRERMLASLGGFFAVVALLLAAVGLYGVLHYSVVRRERELGIRIALGAAAGNIARIVTGRVVVMVLMGAAVGLAAGVGSVRFVESLLYGVKGTDVSMMALPGVVLLLAAGLAALPAVLRAVRIDPAVMLRSE